MSNLKPKIAFLYNPISGSGQSSKYLELLRKQMPLKWFFWAVRTEKNRVTEQVRDICRNEFSHIIVSGGDGTIMEVINGLMTSDNKPVLGIVPYGTGNDLARALGYYKRFKKDPTGYIREFINDIKYQRTGFCRILGINEKLFFSNYLGIGFDAKISREYNKCRSWPIPAKLQYFLCIIRNIFYKSKGKSKLSFSLPDGTTKNILFTDIKNILLMNIPSYSGGLIMFDELETDSDDFQVIVIKDLLEFLIIFISGALSRNISNTFFRKLNPAVYKTDAITIKLHSSENCIQINGEDYTDSINFKRDLRIKVAGRITVFS